MAQPSYAIKYIGAYRIEAGTTYSSASILTAFPGATVMKAKTDVLGDTIKVAVNGSPMFHFEDNEECFIETGMTFTFNKAFTAAIGVYKAVV